MELPDPGDPLRFVKELQAGTEGPATARHALGTARCGPARRVVWGLGGENPPGYPITPGMGVNSWGVSPLYVNPVIG